jgi:hypothetical protein
MISHGRVLKEDVIKKLEAVNRMFHDRQSDPSGMITTRVIILNSGKTVPVTKQDVCGMPYSLPVLPEYCYVGGAEQVKVFEAIAQERKNQEDKWGENKPQSLPGYLLILESELNEAKLGWIKNLPGKSAPLNEIVQIAAVAVACLERYGVSGSTIATDDIPDNEHN